MFSLLVVSLVACDDPTLVCGGGRTLVDGTCLHTYADESPPIAVASPPGGRYPAPVDVEIHAGESGDVFYRRGAGEVTNASPSAPSPAWIEDVAGELRFFAVDAAGNRQVFVGSETYTIDTAGPNVTEIVAHPPDAAGAVLVAWHVPAAEDFEGVLVVRDKTPEPSFSPSRGARYEAGDVVAPGVIVIHAGEQASELDASPAAGNSFYHAWGYDDLANYGDTPASTTADGPLEVNQATILISLQNRTVTLAEPAVDFGLIPSGSFHADGSTVTLRLSVDNYVGRPVANVKLYVESLSSGSAIADADVFGEAVMHLGGDLMDPLERRVAEVTVTGAVPVPDPVQMRLRIRADPTYVLPAEKSGGIAIDGGEPTFDERIACDAIRNPNGFGFGGCAFEGWAWAPEGEVAYAGSRNTPWVAVVDTTTWMAAVGVMLGSHGHVPDVAVSPDGQRLYVAHVEGTHRRGNNNVSDRSIDIVVLDRVSLTELSRIPLLVDLPIGEELRGGSIALSADGQRLVAVFRGRPDMYVVDLSEESVATVTVPVDPLEVSLSPDGQIAYVGAVVQAAIGRVDLDTLTATTIDMPGDRNGAIAVSEGHVFVGSKGFFPGLHVHDLETGTTATLYAGERITAVELIDEGRMVAATSRDLFRVNRVSTTTLEPLPPVLLNVTSRGHDLATNP